MAEFTAEILARMEKLLGDEVTCSVAVKGGYTPAARWLVSLSGGRVFAKMGTTPLTSQELRREWKVYSQLKGRFIPEVVAWEDDPAQPLLVLEDLSSARWPPPWDQVLIDQVRESLNELHATQLPLRTFAEVHGNVGDGWRAVAEDPEPFLALGLVSREWLELGLPVLLHASVGTELAGTEIVHMDVRSDNICQSSRGVVFVDWNCACRGSGALDTGFWLPSLEAEGGPAPEKILPDRPDIAAWVSGFFAARAGLPQIEDAPRVRMVQLQQLRPALRWAARQLELPLFCSPA